MKDYGQLILIGLVVLGWIIQGIAKAAAEQKRKQQQRGQPHEPPVPPATPRPPRDSARGVPPEPATRTSAPPQRPPPRRPPLRGRPPAERVPPRRGPAEPVPHRTAPAEPPPPRRTSSGEGSRAGKPVADTKAPTTSTPEPSRLATRIAVTGHAVAGPQWAETIGEIATRKAGERPKLLARLGIGEAIRTGRDAARAGMLWSEVLGPPVALRPRHSIGWRS